MKRVVKAHRVSFVLVATAVAALAGGAQEPSAPVAAPVQQAGVPIPGEKLGPSALGAGVIEPLGMALQRQASAPAAGSTPKMRPEMRPKMRNGARGTWEVPSRRKNGTPHSGVHYVTARWGDTRMGIGFGAPVDVLGVWVAGHASPQVWAPAIRVVGYRDGLALATTPWFDDVDGTPSWFALGLTGVDRIEVEAQVAFEGAGFFGLDDLTYVRGGVATVLDFEDLDWRAQLSGSAYAGLTWETGTGEFSVVPPPETLPRNVQPAGGGATGFAAGGAADGGTLPFLVNDWSGPDQGDPGAAWIPPDSQGYAGPNHYVAVVNQHLSIYDKATGLRLSSLSLQAFFAGAGTMADSRVLFDHHSGRWVLISSDFKAGVHFAFSLTNDPTGSWFKSYIKLSEGADANAWPDYPTLGVDQNGIYVTAYMVGNAASIFAIDKAPLLQATPALGTVTAWRSLAFEGALQPAITFGAAPGCYVISRFDLNTQRVRIVNPPLDNPTLTQLGFVDTKNGTEPPLAPALGSLVDLDTVSARLMNAVYRNGSLWTTHCVNKAGRAAINWYQIDPGGLTVQMEGTIKDSARSFFFPSLAVNAAGGVVVGFSASSPTTYAGCWYTGRAAGDPPGEMGLPTQYRGGGGPYNQVSNGFNRWGDYSMTSVDPLDDLTFWTIQERARPDGDWETWVAELRLFGCPPPTASQPLSATRCAGQSVTFSTTAGGLGPFSYQWQKDGAAIGGATSSAHTIAAVTPADEGSYTVIVADACGSVTSGAATLTVDDAVTATDPVDATHCTGQSATFSTIAGGTGPFSYQWRKDGALIGGATSASYTLVSVGAADEGDYDAVVSGACGSTTTAAASLTVEDTVTASDPLGATVCPGVGVTFDTTARGAGPFTYQWKKDGAPIGGASSSSYTIAAVTPADAGSYTVEVTGACGMTETGAATLTIDTPVTASDPVGATECPGNPVSFSTTAGGTGPFTFQWKKDGTPIGGASSSSYTIAAVTPADAGDYTVEVTGACGPFETAAALLTVDLPLTASNPSSAIECPGNPVTFSTLAGGTGPFTYQWKKDGTAIAGASSSSYTIAAVAAGDAGDYSVEVTGACGLLETGGATLTVSSAVSASDPVSATECIGNPVSFSTTAGGGGPFTYQWKKDGAPIVGASSSSYTIVAVTLADAGSYTVEVTGGCGTTETGAAVLSISNPVNASNPVGATVCAGAGVTFSTVAGGGGPLTYQWKNGGVDIPGAVSSSYTINPVTVEHEGSYSVLVTGACNSLETAAAVLVVALETTASITPSNAMVCPGAGGTFSTVVGGTGPFTYQWKKNGVAIPGATEAAYSYFSVTEADAGTYSVLVTGACGSVEPSATLTVKAVTTATNPTGVVACLGGPAIFATTAGGSGPFAYQWYRNGLAIEGATGSSHVIEVVQKFHAGNYSVVVVGACGAVETAAAALNIAGLFTDYCTAGTSANGCVGVLEGLGTPSASQISGFSLRGSSIEGMKEGMFFYGTSGRQANSWGNGSSYQCVVPPVLRMGLVSGSGSPNTCDGVMIQDLNATWCPTCPQKEKNPGAGTLVNAQLWYRDPTNTSNQTTSLTHAIEFFVCP